LYGDREHLVTVRAEMSRLRKSLGGLLLARPYRVAPGVDAVLPALTGSALLARSSAPGLRRLAG
ncbi:MAG TPA: transcriptional regulator, partial [Pseudonocardia sp.]|nr:transcriptional regulator [Pseudonocardia sp.]